MKTITALVALALLLSGCGRDVSEGADSVSGSGGDGEVKTIILSDGTKCAVLIGYRKGALSCDWK